ncbi:MAG: hypothetical protein M1536_03705 [Firmicutes bacterium]|nr:hypothetical protein [Bacillota bacterium]
MAPDYPEHREVDGMYVLSSKPVKKKPEQAMPDEEAYTRYLNFDHHALVIQYSAAILIAMGFLEILCGILGTMQTFIHFFLWKNHTLTNLITGAADIFLGIFLLMDQEWARPLVLLRTVVGVIVYAATLIPYGNYFFIGIQVIYSAALIALLSTRGTRVRSNLLGIPALVILVASMIGLIVSPGTYFKGEKLPNGDLVGNKYTSINFRIFLKRPSEDWKIIDKDVNKEFKGGIIKLTCGDANFVLSSEKTAMNETEYADSIETKYLQNSRLTYQKLLREPSIVQDFKALSLTYNLISDHKKYRYRLWSFKKEAINYSAIGWCSEENFSKYENDFQSIIDSLKFI